mmetsp:Transcript_23855/g.51605  ORF Transcript_23855/g.51605 Transcript_23855/m.51605 type:complete len:226 (+) Transcript_23855:536-1213(+)
MPPRETMVETMVRGPSDFAVVRSSPWKRNVHIPRGTRSRQEKSAVHSTVDQRRRDTTRVSRKKERGGGRTTTTTPSPAHCKIDDALAAFALLDRPCIWRLSRKNKTMPRNGMEGRRQDAIPFFFGGMGFFFRHTTPLRARRRRPSSPVPCVYLFDGRRRRNSAREREREIRSATVWREYTCRKGDHVMCDEGHHHRKTRHGDFLSRRRVFFHRTTSAMRNSSDGI